MALELEYLSIPLIAESGGVAAHIGTPEVVLNPSPLDYICGDKLLMVKMLNHKYISVFELQVAQAKQMGFDTGLLDDQGLALADELAWSIGDTGQENISGAEIIRWIGPQYISKFGDNFALPTNREWDSVAIGTPSSDHNYAVYNNPKAENPQGVGTRKSNDFGLYDILGNVGELTGTGYSRGGTIRNTTVSPDSYKPPSNNLDKNIDVGLRLVYTYVPPPTYTLTLTDCTAEPDKEEYLIGDDITLTAASIKGKIWQSWRINDESTTGKPDNTNPYTLIMPEQNTTAQAIYINASFANVTIGGQDPIQIQIGETITLTTDVPRGQYLKAWHVESSDPAGLQVVLPVPPKNALKIPDGCKSLTIVPVFESYVQLRFMNCTTDSPSINPNGYYIPGTYISATFTASVPKGYVMDRWVRPDILNDTPNGDKLTVEGNVPSSNETPLNFYPVFKVDPSESTPDVYDLTQWDTVKAPAPFGWSKDADVVSPNPSTIEGDPTRTVTHTPYGEAHDYAVFTFDQDPRTLEYQETHTHDKTSTPTDTTLYFKRIASQDFYISAYELTEGIAVQYLGGNPPLKRSPKHPCGLSSAADANGILKKLNDILKAQQENIGVITVAHPTGEQWISAAGVSPDFADGMNQSVFNSETPAHVGSKEVGSTGLYDIRGNYAEYCSDGNRYGLNSTESITGEKTWDTIFKDNVPSAPITDNRWWTTTLRPLIPTEPLINFTFLGIKINVPKNTTWPETPSVTPSVTIPDPKRTGYHFEGWVNGATPVTSGTLLTDGMVIMPSWAARPVYTVIVNDRDIDSEILRLTPNSDGIATTKIYAAFSFGDAPFSHWRITKGDASAVTLSDDKALCATVTLSKPADVTLEAVYVKPGFSIKIR